jgi:hypothetical protein
MGNLTCLPCVSPLGRLQILLNPSGTGLAELLYEPAKSNRNAAYSQQILGYTPPTYYKAKEVQPTR